MMIGTVIGQVFLDRGVPGASGGERVLVAAGDNAGTLCPEFPVDTVILGVAANNG